MAAKRILALGAGAMGAQAATMVAAFPEVKSLMVADLNLEAAQRVAAACGGKAQAASIDVTNAAELISAMRAADLVMNCVGPFFRFGVPVLKAAMAAGVDYLDICDDPEPTRAMHECRAQAEKAGITAIVGLGASPGLTSLLAARACAELDEVKELIAAWNIEEKCGGDDDDRLSYSAAIVHWMQQCSGKILECEGGRLVGKEPLLDVSLDYPGRGRRTVYTVGHPEPVSFHYSYPDLPRSFCVMVMPSSFIGDFRGLAQQIKAGLSLEEAGKLLVESSAQGCAELAHPVDHPRLPLFFALAKGTSGGRPTVAAASIKAIPAGMAKATGIPLALGTRLVLQGRVAAKGVIAPELAFEATEFFNQFAPYCTFPAPAAASELVEVALAQG